MEIKGPWHHFYFSVVLCSMSSTTTKPLLNYLFVLLLIMPIKPLFQRKKKQQKKKKSPYHPLPCLFKTQISPTTRILIIEHTNPCEILQDSNIIHLKGNTQTHVWKPRCIQSKATPIQNPDISHHKKTNHRTYKPHVRFSKIPTPNP